MNVISVINLCAYGVIEKSAARAQTEDVSKKSNSLYNEILSGAKKRMAIKDYLGALNILLKGKEPYSSIEGVLVDSLDIKINTTLDNLSIPEEKLEAAKTLLNAGSVYLSAKLYRKVLEESDLSALLEEEAKNGLNQCQLYREFINLEKSGKIKQAQECLARIIQSNPNLWIAHFRLGQYLYDKALMNLYNKSGSKEKAIDYTKKAVKEFEICLRINPDFAPAKNGIVMAQESLVLNK